MFNGADQLAGVLFWRCGVLYIEDCTFKCRLALGSLNIASNFNILGTKFLESVAIDNIAYDDKVTKLDYDSLRSLLTCNNVDSVPYFPVAGNLKALADEGNYKALLATLYNLHALYKSQGDIRSANKVYVDIHNYETNMLGYLYYKAPSLENYFSWLLNRFLRKFCDYGTNPIRSLKYAFYTMLLFSLLYFLFPSETDNLSSGRLAMAMEKILGRVGVLKPENPSPSPFSAETVRLNGLLQLTETHRNAMPRPLFSLGRLLIKTTLGYFRYVNRLRIPYPAAPAGTAFGSKWTFYSVVYLTAFVLAGIFMRLLNAVALSINAFVTLGYGELSAKGVARYLVVLEGAIGWFLLGIFSVSLISQILG